MTDQVRDPFSGLEVRPTNNGLKNCDLEAPQTAARLELDERGLPVDFNPKRGE